MAARDPIRPVGAASWPRRRGPRCSKTYADLAYRAWVRPRYPSGRGPVAARAPLRRSA